MNNPLLFPIILQIVAVFIIGAEILIPSGGILAMLATAVLGYSLYLVFSTVSASVGFYFILADLILVPIVVILGFKTLAKSPVTLKKRLSSEQGVNVQNKDLQQYIGKQGVAITDLRPSGIAMIDQKRLDVVTEGKYLGKNSPLTVVSVTGNQMIVKENPKKGVDL